MGKSQINISTCRPAHGVELGGGEKVLATVGLCEGRKSPGGIKLIQTPSTQSVVESTCGVMGQIDLYELTRR